MSLEAQDARPSVDVIIPVYGERPEALAATVSGCLAQTYPVSEIYVVDDGSPAPVTLSHLVEASGKVHLHRLPENSGISVARNTAIAQSSSPLLWCINTEIIPASDWLQTCVDYLATHREVGACYTRLVPKTPKRLWSRWRMRFMETRFEGASGPAPFAPGHSVLLRRDAVESVKGYDPQFLRINEDSDICKRMREAGWETHYVASSFCVSIQEDTLQGLSGKLLVRSNWFSPESYSLPRVFMDQSKWFLVRSSRNIVKGRFSLLPADVALWAGAITVACRRKVAERLAHRQRELRG